MGLALIVGVFAVLFSYPKLRLERLPQYVRHMPLPIKILILLVPLTILFSSMHGKAESVVMLGSAARLDGALIQVGWYVGAIVAFYLSRKDLIPKTIPLSFTIIGAGFVGAWAGLQVLGIEPLSLVGFDLLPLGSPSGPLGHRALTTCYVGIGLAVTLTWASLSIRHQWLLTVLCGLFGGLIVAAEGRAGIAGAIIAWFVLGLILILRRARLMPYLIATVAILVGGGAVALTKSHGLRPFESLAAATQGEDRSFRSRYEYFWPVAVKAIGQKPLVGWGIEGFSEAFWERATADQQYQVVRMHISPILYPEVRTTGTPVQIVRRSHSGRNEYYLLTVDRAHNWLLDTAVSFGVPFTLVLLLALFVWAVSIARSQSASALALGSGALVYLAFSITWFATLPLTPIFWVLFGASLGNTDRTKS